MNEKRIAPATFLPLLLVCGVSAQDRLAEHLQALSAAGFVGVSASPPPPVPTAQEVFSTEYIYPLNEAVSIFPAIKERQDVYHNWANARTKEPRTSANFEVLHGLVGPLGEVYSSITTYTGDAGQLNLRTLAIPLYTSRWRLISLESRYLSYVRGTNYDRYSLEHLLDYYKKHGDVTSLTSDYTNEKRVKAMITALELQKDYAKILLSLLPETARWYTSNGHVNVDHLEPGQVSSRVWSTLKETAAAIDAALDLAEAEEARDPWHRGVTITRPAIPPLLTAAFFTDLYLPVEASERKRAETVRAMKANKVENCPKGTCFYDENGRLSHWVQQGRKGYITGYASVEQEQKSFNAWADRIWHTSRPKHVSQSGHLNIETFRIPVVKADYEIGEMWSRLLRDAQGQFPDSQAVGIRAYLKIPGGQVFGDGIFKTRADTIAAAYSQARAYEQALVPLNALRDPGVDQNEIERDPLEASRFPAGMAEKLAALRRSLEQAVAGAAEVEAAAR